MLQLGRPTPRPQATSTTIASQRLFGDQTSCEILGAVSSVAAYVATRCVSPLGIERTLTVNVPCASVVKTAIARPLGAGVPSGLATSSVCRVATDVSQRWLT